MKSILGLREQKSDPELPQIFPTETQISTLHLCSFASCRMSSFFFAGFPRNHHRSACTKYKLAHSSTHKTTQRLVSQIPWAAMAFPTSDTPLTLFQRSRSSLANETSEKLLPPLKKTHSGLNENDGFPPEYYLFLAEMHRIGLSRADREILIDAYHNNPEQILLNSGIKGKNSIQSLVDYLSRTKSLPVD